MYNLSLSDLRRLIRTAVRQVDLVQFHMVGHGTSHTVFMYLWAADNYGSADQTYELVMN